MGQGDTLRHDVGGKFARFEVVIPFNVHRGFLPKGACRLTGDPGFQRKADTLVDRKPGVQVDAADHFMEIFLDGPVGVGDFAIFDDDLARGDGPGAFCRGRLSRFQQVGEIPLVRPFAHDLHKWPADAYRRDQEDLFLEHRRQQNMEGDLIGLHKNALGRVFLVDGQVAHDKSAQGTEADIVDGDVALEIFSRPGDDEALELHGQKNVLNIKRKEIGQDKNRQEGIDCLARPVY